MAEIQQKKPQSFITRYIIIAVLFMLIMLLLIVRLFYLQFFKSAENPKYFLIIIDNRSERNETIFPSFPEIYLLLLVCRKQSGTGCRVYGISFIPKPHILCYPIVGEKSP